MLPMKNSLLIHHNNVAPLDFIDKKIRFNLISGDVDRYITDDIIPQIKKINPTIIYIKDNLSAYYLELFGLQLAYHIRLSREIKEIKFVPIVIISDVDVYILNRLTKTAQILFTKNIFISQNNRESIENFSKLKLKNLSKNEYKNEFLHRIDIEAPQENSHDISNEWAIYRWAEFLKINDSKAIDINREKIASMLYFKYLLAKNPISIKKKNGIQFVPRPPENSGKILYIDDEWAKGWSDILKRYFSKNSNIEFKTFEYEFKDSNQFTLRSAIQKYCESYSPDVVLLDLRLTQNDHTTTQIENLTGIKITQMIKEINPAMQVIILSATSKSTILENLYKHGILGYIKKEHPTDVNISTKENFDKLKGLVDRGFEKKYLKEVWEIQKCVLALDIFQKDKFRQMRFEIDSIFEILDSDMNKRYIYAMLSIHQCLEEINNHFIDDKKGVWIDSKNAIEGKTTTKNKILEVLHKRLSLYGFDEKIQEITHLRNGVIHPNNRTISIDSHQILVWFKMLETILRKINQ